MQIIILTFIALWLVAILTLLFHFKKLQYEIKEEKKGKEDMSLEDKANILLTFVNDNKRVPKRSEVVDEFKVGHFWDNIKQGQSSKIYKLHLSMNPILSADYENIQKNKEEKNKKE